MAKSDKFDLKAVKTALEEAGLDPVVEITKILKGRPKLDPVSEVQLRDPQTGEPVVDHYVDADTRLKTLLELNKFIAPTLKAVEQTTREEPLTYEQVNMKIAALLEVRQAKQAVSDAVAAEIAGGGGLGLNGITASGDADSAMADARSQAAAEKLALGRALRPTNGKLARPTNGQVVPSALQRTKDMLD